MKKLYSSLIMLALAMAGDSVAQTTLWNASYKNNTTTVYSRIPAILKDNAGNLMAFSDVRYGGSGDIGANRIDISARTSSDNGLSWADASVIINGVDNASSGSHGFNYGHGDAAVVCDRESGKILLMCASGNITYGLSTTTAEKGSTTYTINTDNAIRTGRYYYENGTWNDGTDVTSSIYNLWQDQCSGSNYNVTSPLQRCFFSSGRICQSEIVKNGNYYRLYAALCSDIGSLVVYSDDFGDNWNVLGNTNERPATNGDEAKIVELPNGNVLLSCRSTNGYGRIFNIFTYTDNSHKNGSWGTAVTSGETNATGETFGAQCNGEVLLVKDKAGEYVLLQSVPMNNNREKVGIYYKYLNSESDYDEPSDFKEGWSAYNVSTTSSAYSSMVEDAEGNIAFIYEENSTNGAYDIMFKSLTLDEITKAGDTSDPWVGKVFTIKGVTYDEKGNIENERYLYDEDGTLKTINANNVTSHGYGYYWVVSKDPDSKTYYLSSLTGDGYMGAGEGKSFFDGSVHNNIPICTDDMNKQFVVHGFDKSYGDNGSEMNGYVIKFWDTNGNTYKVLSIANDDGEINWFDHSAKREATTVSSNRYWSTDFEFTEVTTTDAIDNYGTITDPTHFGFKVTFVRTDDGKTIYDYEDNNFYATLKLPYAVTLPENVKAYKCTSFSGVAGDQVGLEELTLEENILPRETPVILCMEKEDGETETVKTIYLQPALAKEIQGTGFKGVLRAKTMEEYDYESNPYIYVLGKENGRVAMYKFASQNFAANKAYYEYNGVASSSALSFSFGGSGTTGINNAATQTGDNENGPIYDLSGRRVTSPAKGIYIRNNKKVIIR